VQQQVERVRLKGVGEVNPRERGRRKEGEREGESERASERAR